MVRANFLVGKHKSKTGLEFLLSLASRAVVLMTVSGFCTLSTYAAEKSHTSHASTTVSTWVVMGENGQSVVRSLSTAAQCPMLKQDGKSKRMLLRAPAETMAQRKTASSEVDSKPSAFPLITCEANLLPSVKKAKVDGVSVPLAKSVFQRIVVIGDTGCRMKKADDAFQACNDNAQWVFNEVAKKAASMKPDLVIHLGDYHYRENVCPDGNQGCSDSPWGYGYDVWKADFFEPAKPLLQAAPWVMVRGNHESCSRAGQGYWRFLDPRPYVAGRDCDLEQNDMIGDYSEPYAVKLGRSGGQTAQLIVFDSSKVPGKKLKKEDAAFAIFSEQFAKVDDIAEAADFNIFMNHHPSLGFAASHKADGSVEFKPGNQTLQAVMQGRHPKRLFPAKVQAVLSGHVHLFQAVSFSSDHPTQFGSGNGGTAMDKPLPNQLPENVTPFESAVVDHFSNSNQDGFMLIERKRDRWIMSAFDKEGNRMTQCKLQNAKTNCTTNLK